MRLKRGKKGSETAPPASKKAELATWTHFAVRSGTQQAEQSQRGDSVRLLGQLSHILISVREDRRKEVSFNFLRS